MATHDYVIDNSTGANVRVDINNALLAIVSNNSNSSSPSTTYAYQWWADTSNNVLKIRNSANNAWIELLQLDGTLTLEDGSASTPALAFRDDLNTGIFSSAADTFNVATAGVERLELGATTIFNEDGADVDFRIEGDTNANLFYVDAGNDAVGIGTSSPLTDAELTISAADTPALAFQRSGSGKFETAIAIESGHFFFKAGADSTTVAGLSDVMKIESTGKVGIGTTSPASLLTLNHATNPAIQFQDSGTKVMSINAEGSFANIASFEGKALQFATNSGSGFSSAMVIDTSQRVGIGTTSPSQELTVAGSDPVISVQEASVSSQVDIGTGTATGFINIQKADGTRTVQLSGSTDSYFTGGDVGIGISSPASLLHVSSSTNSYFRFQDLASETIGVLIRKNTTSTYTAIDLRNANGPSGTLTVSNNSVSLSNASDYRLKENETVISDGTTKIKQLIPRRFNFKVEPDRTVDGFFAHEVSGVVPEAVIGEKDATIDEDGNGYQSLDATKLIPILTAGLKEAISKIETLETKVAALEAA